LRGKRCVVVGGGRIASRKVTALLLSGANVTVISPSVTGVLQEYCERKRIKHIRRKYRKGDLEDTFLTVAATLDRQVNREVSNDAPCLINAADDPGLCNFIVPSVVKRGYLTIAVSTSGTSPQMAKSIRKELEQFYGREFGLFGRFLKEQRDKLKEDISDDRARQRLMKKIAGPEMVKTLREKGFERTKVLVRKILKESL